MFIAPLLSTYHQLGINAVYRPINDIHVEGRKIGGTGAARIGEAEVVVGSIMFNFDGTTMAKALKVSSEKMRDKLIDTLSEYVTSIARELQYPVDRGQILKDYINQVQLTLGRTVEPGKLSAKEERALKEARQLLSNESWVYAGPGRKVLGTRIHQDVTVHEGVHKATGGLLRWLFIEKDGVIADATIEGDFTIEPADIPLRLAEFLIGASFNATEIGQRIRQFFSGQNPAMPGLTVDDFDTAATAALAEHA
jgi:lipoate-protein ligase A